MVEPPTFTQQQSAGHHKRKEGGFSQDLLQRYSGTKELKKKITIHYSLTTSPGGKLSADSYTQGIQHARDFMNGSHYLPLYLRSTHFYFISIIMTLVQHKYKKTDLKICLKTTKLHVWWSHISSVDANVFNSWQSFPLPNSLFLLLQSYFEELPKYDHTQCDIDRITIGRINVHACEINKTFWQ